MEYRPIRTAIRIAGRNIMQYREEGFCGNRNISLHRVADVSRFPDE